MDLILPFLSGFLITLFTLPPTIYLAQKYGLIDDPNSRPHPAHTQSRIVPRAGGLAIFTGLVTSILLLVPLQKHIIGIIISLTLLLIMGLLDDKLKTFNPYFRLSLQFLAAAIIVASGVGITFTTNPFGGILRLDQIVIPFELFGTHYIYPIADLLSFIWIVWVMNIVNWSKGVDGQMPGIILVAALTIAFVAYNFYSQGDPNQLHLSSLGFITAGTALAFLIFNWHPAKIFPGFSGSTIFGLMIATLSILSSAKIATALLVMLIPVIDFVYTFSRRILSGKSPVWADKGHLHHKLLNLGWSHQKISLFYILTCATLGILATILTSLGKFILAASLSIIIFGAIIYLHILLQKNRKND